MSIEGEADNGERQCKTGQNHGAHGYKCAVEKVEGKKEREEI